MPGTTRRRGRVALLVAAIAASTASFGPSQVAAQGSNPGPSSNEVLFLLLPVGAQGVGLGRSMTALASRESAFWNPAGLASVEGRELVVFRGNTITGTQTAVSTVFGRSDLGTVAVSYHLLDIGESPFIDENNQPVGSVTVRSHQALASFATRLGQALEAGLNFKLLFYRQSCRGQCPDAGLSATSYAIDGGIQATPVEGQPLRLGAMIAHAGPRVQFINAAQADPLPTRIRLAASYDVLHSLVDNPAFRLWTSLEVEDRWNDLGNRTYYLGGELQVGTDEILFVRAGWGYEELDALEQAEGGAVGLGVRYERFDLGIARSVGGRSLGPESEPTYLTLGVAF